MWVSALASMKADERPPANAIQDIEGTLGAARYTTPADTTSVPILMANASDGIVASENDSLATTRNPPATASASHATRWDTLQALGDMLILLVALDMW
jgi:hypothetical protein